MVTILWMAIVQNLSLSASSYLAQKWPKSLRWWVGGVETDFSVQPPKLNNYTITYTQIQSL